MMLRQEESESISCSPPCYNNNINNNNNNNINNNINLVLSHLSHLPSVIAATLLTSVTHVLDLGRDGSCIRHVHAIRLGPLVRQQRIG
jgi:hypothetical protein